MNVSHRKRVLLLFSETICLFRIFGIIEKKGFNCVKFTFSFTMSSQKTTKYSASRVTIILRTLNGLQKLKKISLNPQGPHADKAWNTKYFKIPLFWKKSLSL